jgi:ribosomal protein L12E/L44/L45/RPP1/RPP2
MRMESKQTKIISKGKPASQIKPVRKDSKKAVILLATLKGVTIEDIMKLTGWAKSAASSAIATERSMRACIR